MKTLIIMMIIIILPMMINTEKLVVLENYFKSLIEIITNQIKLMLGLQEEKIITLNIRVKEIDMIIYHLKNILM